jgi:hypothetical protein
LTDVALYCSKAHGAHEVALQLAHDDFLGLRGNSFYLADDTADQSGPHAFPGPEHWTVTGGVLHVRDPSRFHASVAEAGWPEAVFGPVVPAPRADTGPR